MSSAVVFGSTGLVGSNILSTLLTTNTFPAVTTISRRPPKTADAGAVTKLTPVIDADTAAWPAKLKALAPPPAVVFSALGTSPGDAGGIAGQWKIDHDLNVDLARAAKEAGAPTFVFISSAGTRGLFAGRVPYSRMKVGVEDAVEGLDFEHSIVLRPGAILGDREVPKNTWLVGAIRGIGRASTAVRDVLGQEADVIGRAAVNAAALAAQGKAPSKHWVLSGADIIKYGSKEFKL